VDFCVMSGTDLSSCFKSPDSAKKVMLGYVREFSTAEDAEVLIIPLRTCGVLCGKSCRFPQHYFFITTKAP
jgi:hypothetical protein